MEGTEAALAEAAGFRRQPRFSLLALRSILAFSGSWTTM